MSTQRGWAELSDVMERLLRLRTVPVAVSLLDSTESIPQEAGRPPEPLTVTQLVTLCQQEDRAIAATVENMACVQGSAALGLEELPSDLKSGERAVGFYAETAEVAAKIFADNVYIEQGKFSAVIFSPLPKTPIEPNLVLVFGNSAQMMRLAYGIRWKKGDRVICDTNGSQGTCSEAIAATYVYDVPRLALPCYGARRYGLRPDDEMIMGIPADRVEEIVCGLESSHACGATYPIKRYGLISPLKSEYDRRIRR